MRNKQSKIQEFCEPIRVDCNIILKINKPSPVTSKQRKEKCKFPPQIYRQILVFQAKQKDTKKVNFTTKKMEFLLDFNKTQKSTKVLKFLKFLEANIPKEQDEAIKSVVRLLKGNKVQYKEANELLDIILGAIIFNDREEDELIVEEKDEGHTDNPTPGGSKDIVIPEKKSDPEPKLGPKTDPKTDPKICHFYKNGKCKYNSECKFSHPPMCYKFRANGAIKYNN